MSSELLIYQTDDGETRITIRFENGTVWLTQEQIAELFQRNQSVISRHIKNVFADGELEQESNMQKMHIANSDKPVAYDKYKERIKNEITKVEIGFMKQLESTSQKN
jgi:hypothetical protein